MVYQQVHEQTMLIRGKLAVYAEIDAVAASVDGKTQKLTCKPLFHPATHPSGSTGSHPVRDDQVD